MIVIRSMQRGDVVPAIQLLIGGALGVTVEDPSREAEYWEAVQDIGASGGTVLVADDDGEVVGICQVFTFRHFQHVGGRAAEVESVHVRADRRSQGIGEQLRSWARPKSSLASMAVIECNSPVTTSASTLIVSTFVWVTTKAIRVSRNCFLRFRTLDQRHSVGSTHNGASLATQGDVVTAFNDATSRSAAESISADLAGSTMISGVYKASTRVALSGTLTLNGQGHTDAVSSFRRVRP